jgi:putative transposase
MILPLLTAIRSTQCDHQIAMEQFYRYLGITRQAYFQALSREAPKKIQIAEMIKLVKEYRSKHDRRAGSRSLYYNLEIKTKFDIGISKFEQLMSQANMSLVPLRINVVTTKSSLQSWNYNNLASGLIIRGINELVVGDLTYVVIGSGRYFLFCLTDVYSARIVGYHLAERMRAVEAKRAFDMWVKLRSGTALKSCIHHTDGGSQYFSQLYLSAINALKIKVSVAENCLENGYAEQRNGLIKHHLLPTIDLSKGKTLFKEIARIIHTYNHDRKQENLNWLSPVNYEEQKKHVQKQIFKFKKD